MSAGRFAFKPASPLPTETPNFRSEHSSPIGVENRDIFSDVTSSRKKAADRPGTQKLPEHATTGHGLLAGKMDRIGRLPGIDPATPTG